MNISMPTFPILLPPSVTATSTQMEEAPRNCPPHRVNQVPLNLLEHKEDDGKDKRVHGFHHQHKEYAHSQPEKAPNMGIRAVNAMSTPISRA